MGEKTPPSETPFPSGWDLIIPAESGEVPHMEVDLVLLTRRVPSLRIYEWSRPTLSIGSHQTLPAEVLERCRAAEVAVVRRPTGGGAVLHSGDITYSVVGREPHGASVLSVYRSIAQPLIEGFRLLGLEAEVAEHRGPARAMDCFAQPTGADLQVGGRKICGSAQLRRGGWFLQHGTIPIQDRRELSKSLLGSDGGESTTLQELRPGTTTDEVKAAVLAGFIDTFGQPRQMRTLDHKLHQVSGTTALTQRASTL